ncbi:hypothetical protein HGRIS_010729 [Hohenbuehelia grisea]|uniref:Transmembrane protein n=1 Tax=Hohenbuehelia grisea TaxID=104357 RepID=A0ABR3IXN9_9AGAR
MAPQFSTPAGHGDRPSPAPDDMDTRLTNKNNRPVLAFLGAAIAFGVLWWAVNRLGKRITSHDEKRKQQERQKARAGSEDETLSAKSRELEPGVEQKEWALSQYTEVGTAYTPSKTSVSLAQNQSMNPNEDSPDSSKFAPRHASPVFLAFDHEENEKLAAFYTTVRSTDMTSLPTDEHIDSIPGGKKHRPRASHVRTLLDERRIRINGDRR